MNTTQAILKRRPQPMTFVLPLLYSLNKPWKSLTSSLLGFFSFYKTFFVVKIFINAFKDTYDTSLTSLALNTTLVNPLYSN